MSKQYSLEKLYSFADKAFGDNNWSYNITNQIIGE